MLDASNAIENSLVKNARVLVLLKLSYNQYDWFKYASTSIIDLYFIFVKYIYSNLRIYFTDITYAVDFYSADKQSNESFIATGQWAKLAPCSLPTALRTVGTTSMYVILHDFRPAFCNDITNIVLN